MAEADARIPVGGTAIDAGSESMPLSEFPPANATWEPPRLIVLSTDQTRFGDGTINDGDGFGTSGIP